MIGWDAADKRMGVGCLGNSFYSPTSKPSICRGQKWQDYPLVQSGLVHLQQIWPCLCCVGDSAWAALHLKNIPHPQYLHACTRYLHMAASWSSCMMIQLPVLSQVLCHLLVKLIPNRVILFNQLLNLTLHLYMVCHTSQSELCNVKNP